MKPTTNIYLLADISFRNIRNADRLQQLFTKMSRELEFMNERTNLRIIGFNDRAKLLSPFERIKTGGNPDLAEGLSFLSSALTLDKHDGKPRTKSIFILFTGENVLQGWQPKLQELFKNKDFAFGLRYVVTLSQPDKYTRKVAEHFTDSSDRILPYFSASRLGALVKTFQYN